MMKTASVATIKAQLSAYLKAAQDGPVVVTRNGKPVAVILAVHDEEELERLLLAHSAKFQALLDAAEHRLHSTGGLRHEEFWAAVETDAEGTEPASSDPSGT
jgi:prevent-host-death family protein